MGGGNDGTCGGDKSVCGTYASALGYADDLANRAKHGFSQYHTLQPTASTNILYILYYI